jgi:hypothetical protein
VRVKTINFTENNFSARSDAKIDSILCGDWPQRFVADLEDLYSFRLLSFNCFLSKIVEVNAYMSYHGPVGDINTCTLLPISICDMWFYHDDAAELSSLQHGKEGD